jgi:hypothetical protein
MLRKFEKGELRLERTLWALRGREGRKAGTPRRAH